MAEITVSEFRQKFPMFDDTTKYSDSFIQSMIDVAKLYISPEPNCMVSVEMQKQMIYLMTAHLLTLNYQIMQGDMSSASGQVASASVGGVSVSKAIPNNKTELDYWLNLTPFGMQLLALLSLMTGVGFYVGGQRENVFR